jgi:hypothetical protein
MRDRRSLKFDIAKRTPVLKPAVAYACPLGLKRWP